jgi:hypothetical protein
LQTPVKHFTAPLVFSRNPLLRQRPEERGMRRIDDFFDLAGTDGMIAIAALVAFVVFLAL